MNSRDYSAPTPRQTTNDQLAECIRSHVLAVRGEMTRRFDELSERLGRLPLRDEMAQRLDDLEKRLERIEAALEAEGRKP